MSVIALHACGRSSAGRSECGHTPVGREKSLTIQAVHVRNEQLNREQYGGLRFLAFVNRKTCFPLQLNHTAATFPSDTLVGSADV